MSDMPRRVLVSGGSSGIGCGLSVVWGNIDRANQALVFGHQARRDVVRVGAALGYGARAGLGRGCRGLGLGCHRLGCGLGLFLGGLGQVGFQIVQRPQVVFVGHANGLHHGQVRRLGRAVWRAGEDKLRALVQQPRIEKGVQPYGQLGGVGQVLALNADLIGAAKPHDALPFGLGHPGLTAYVAAKVHVVVPCITVAAVVAFRKYMSPRCTWGGEGEERN